MHLILGPDGLTTELNFKIPIVTLKNNKVNRVGVFVSGGLDAAALLCLIISELKATNRLDSTGITAFTIIKDDGSTYYAQRVIDKISNHFGISITHVNNLLNDTDAYAAGQKTFGVYWGGQLHEKMSIIQLDLIKFRIAVEARTVSSRHHRSDIHHPSLSYAPCR